MSKGSASNPVGAISPEAPGGPIIIIRAAEVVIGNEVIEQLRSALPSGAIVEMSRIDATVNPAKSLSPRRCEIRLALTFRSADYLARLDYWPVIIVGSMSARDLQQATRESPQTSFIIVNVSVNADTAKARYRVLRSRRLHTYMDPPDRLSALRATRSLKRLVAETEADANAIIAAAGDTAVTHIDASNLESGRVASELLRMIHRVERIDGE